MESYKFTISHRKGKKNVVPDTLSRMYENEIASIEHFEPEIDLNSEHFFDDEYV